MSKFLYPIKNLEIMPWIKHWLLKRGSSPSYPLSEIIIGASPLTLINSVRKIFNIFNISGNTIQDGTPTPESPIPIQNVSGEVEVKIENKNLFDKNNANVLTATYFNSSSILSGVGNRCIYIPIKPNTTYTIQKMVQLTTSSNRLRLGTTTDIPAVGVTINNYINLSDGSTGTSLTITTGANDKYLVAVVYYTDSQTSFGTMLNSIQIEEGSTATSYEPHEEQTATLHLPEGMEMCRIENTTIPTGQDKFIKTDNKWYKYKVINRVSFNGNSRWTYNATIKSFVLSNLNIGQYTGVNYKSYCNRFLSKTAYSDLVVGMSFGLNLVITTQGSLDGTQSLADFKSYLNSYPLSIYYTLKEPVLEEITDTTLISDLENLKNLYSYKGTTYISSSSVPSPVFEVQYYMEGE